MGKKSSQKRCKKMQEERQQSPSSPNVEIASRIGQRITTSFTGERVIALHLILIALVLLTVAAIFIWSELTKPKPISRYLPPDTIAFAEIDANLDGTQWQKYESLTQGTGAPSATMLIKTLDEVLNINFGKDVYPWIARRMGIALLADRRSALFLEVKDAEKALIFFQNYTLSGITEKFHQKNIENVTVYQYIASSPITLIPLGKYIIVASNETAAAAIIRASKGIITSKKQNLYSLPAFQRVRNALPQNHFGFMYGKPSELFLLTRGKIKQSLEEMIPAQVSAPPEQISGPMTSGALFTKIPSEVATKLQSAIAHNFTSEAVSINLLDDKFSLEHIMTFTDLLRKNDRFVKVPEKYRANLAEYFSDQTSFFFGGQNIGYIMSKIGTILATKDLPAQEMEKLIRGQITERLNGNMTYNEFIKKTDHEFAIGYDNGEWKILFAEEQHRTQKPEKSLKNSPSFTSYFLPQLASGDDIMYIRPQKFLSEINSAKSSSIASSTSFLPPSLGFLSTFKELSIGTNAFEDGLKTLILVSPQ